jgi:hypothetical protein
MRRIGKGLGTPARFGAADVWYAKCNYIKGSSEDVIQFLDNELEDFTDLRALGW